MGTDGGLGGHFFLLSIISLLFSLSLGDVPIQTVILSQRVVELKTTNKPNFQMFVYTKREGLSMTFVMHMISNLSSVMQEMELVKSVKQVFGVRCLNTTEIKFVSVKLHGI